MFDCYQCLALARLLGRTDHTPPYRIQDTGYRILYNMNLNTESNAQNLDTATSHAKAVGGAQSETATTLGEATHTIAATGSFKPYDTQLPIAALSGYRVVKCLYKENPKTGKKAGVNSYIHIADSINAESVREQLDSLMPHIVSYLQSVEDEIVKGKHKAGTVFLSEESLGLQVVTDKLEEKGVRLNKEAVEAWFTSEIAELLMLALAEKLELRAEDETGELSDSISDSDLAKLLNITEMYKGKYSSLAGGKTSYEPKEAEVLQNALVAVGAEKGGIGERFYARLEGMKNKKVLESIVDFGL